MRIKQQSTYMAVNSITVYIVAMISSLNDQASDPMTALA